MSTSAVPLPGPLIDSGVLAIIRGDYAAAKLGEVAEALFAGGVRVVEVAANSRDAIAAIGALRASEKLVVGAGTILSRDAGEQFLEAGASFLVMPHVDEEIVEWAAGAGVPSLPGAFTATESLRAWRAGASGVKLFPAALSPEPELGPAYLAALRGPLPDIPFVPTGGISSANAAAFIAAGAVAVAAASWLVPQRASDFSPAAVTRRGRELVAAIAEGRRMSTTRDQPLEV